MGRTNDSGERLEFLWLELTASCNLECSHCYTESGPSLPIIGALGTEDWRRLLDDAAALGCRRVQFIGGEPTLHPGLPELIAHARARAFDEVCVYTNGTRFTAALKQAFIEHRVALAFSVYGASAEVHDAVTRRKGSFARTCDALRWAVAAGLSVRAGVITMARNRNEIEATKSLLAEIGVRQVDVDRTRGVGRGVGSAMSSNPLKELCGRCGNARLAVSHAGIVHPCVFARTTNLGPALDGGLAAAINGETRRRFQNALIDAFQRTASRCAPEQPVPPCTPEKPMPPCTPEKNPGPCTPEKPTICNPEIARADSARVCMPESPDPRPQPRPPPIPPGKCSPEVDPGPCHPEIPPGDCLPETGRALRANEVHTAR